MTTKTGSRRATRFLLVACLTVVGCASPGGGAADYRRVLDFASLRLAQGDAGGAREALVELRFREAEDPDRRRYFQLLGDSSLALGASQDAIDAYHRARAHAASDDTETIRTTGIGIARANQDLRRWRAAERHLEEALSYTEETDQRDRIYVMLADGALEQGDTTAARNWLGKVRDRGTWRYSALAERARSAPVNRRPPVADRSRPRPVLPRPVPADPTPTRPRVVTPQIFARADWGAGSIRSSGNPEPMEKPWRITVHHGGEEQPDAPVSKRAAIDRMRSYQSAHFQRGWADIGYHFVIDGAGRIWEGRLTRWQGAHAGNADLNRGNIGICLMGNYEERQPSAEQVSALRSLLTWLTAEYGIRGAAVVGHDEGMAGISKGTACPGRYLQSVLREIRTQL